LAAREKTKQLGEAAGVARGCCERGTPGVAAPRSCFGVVGHAAGLAGRRATQGAAGGPPLGIPVSKRAHAVFPADVHHCRPLTRAMHSRPMHPLSLRPPSAPFHAAPRCPPPACPAGGPRLRHRVCGFDQAGGEHPEAGVDPAGHWGGPQGGKPAGSWGAAVWNLGAGPGLRSSAVGAQLGGRMGLQGY
jgi:hypothetical protein